MKNALILGSGRSGTSLLAGTLANCGYFLGENSYPANEENPKGYFEDDRINRINEELLAQVVPFRIGGVLRKYLMPLSMPYGMRWLARVPLKTHLSCSASLANRIESFTRYEPYCFKDPRLSYTLQLWRPFLKNTVFLCVFRNPAATVNSIITHCSKGEYRRGIIMNAQRAFAVWELIYQHILEIHYVQGGEWVFVHYDQMLDGSCYERLELILGVHPDATFVDRKLNRSRSGAQLPQKVAELYQRLCELAEYGKT